MDGNTLYALMKRTGLTAPDIAGRLGIKRQQVNAWLRGARPIPAHHQAKLRELADEIGGAASPMVDMAATGPGSGWAMPSAASEREFDRMVAAAQHEYRNRLAPGAALAALAGKPVDPIALIGALFSPSAERLVDDAVREIWFRTGRRVDRRIIMGMSEDEIARRDAYTAQQRAQAQRQAAARSSMSYPLTLYFSYPIPLQSPPGYPTLLTPTTRLFDDTSTN